MHTAPQTPAKQQPVHFAAELLEIDPQDSARSFAGAVRAFARRLPAESRSTFLMRLDHELYSLHGEAAIATNGGLHPKHDLIKYHDFFVRHIGVGSRVLDLGCGVGEVSLSIAQRCGAIVTGLDLNEASLLKASEKAAAIGLADRTRFGKADITTSRIGETFDVIVLSNVLEHLEQRSQLLAMWQAWYQPSVVLIRVPAFDRDWRVPWKEQLGVEWRLDDTHFTEYTQDQLEADIRNGGLVNNGIYARWGEYYAVASAK
jgi:SAM-dependent methyltransferase